MPIADFAHRPRLAELRRLGGVEAADVTLARAAETRFTTQAARRPRVSPPEHFEGRTGYAAHFLEDFDVAMPEPVGRRASDVLPVDHAEGGRLDYQHFSVVMSKTRRMAMFVAVNIDGSKTKKIERSRDVWSLDGRIPLDMQIGEELYVDNLLDRGHLVRREDPNWGSDSTAAIANADSFHFTNCSPQMGAFNQKTWLGLETYVLDNARAWRERITVFSGPIFTERDLGYRGVKIPTAYWKVIAFLSDEGKPSATAYTVDQLKELDELESAFGAYRTYQRSVAQIQKLTGLSFGPLVDFDGFSNEEAATSTEIAAELRTQSDIRV